MDSQRLILFFVFSFSVFLLLDAWQRYQQAKAPQPAAVAEEASRTGAGAVPSSAPPMPGEKLRAAEPSVPQPQAPQPGGPAAPAVRVETDLLVAEISTEGASLRHLELKQHRDALDKRKRFVLFEASAERTYLAQSGLIGGELPNHLTRFSAQAERYELAADAQRLEVALRASAPAGVEVVKTYVFRRGSYLVEVRFDIENRAGAPLKPYAYYQLVRDGKPPAGDSAMLPTFTGVAVYTERDKFRKVAFSDIDKNKATYPKNSDDGWIAMLQHYFVGAWLPPNGTPREFYTRRLDNGLYAAGVIVPVGTIAPGGSASVSVPLYAGPQEQEKLAAIAPGLELTVDYGWLTIIAAPLFWVLAWLHRWVGNWGVAIIVLTVLIKLLFYPLSAASYRSMAKMRVLAPKLQRIKDQYGNDRQRMQQAMMELYKTEKINPLGGCMPIIVQIPVFIALYWVLLASVELRHAPFVLWIEDLSAPDPWYILPILMGLTMVVQTWLNPEPPDPVQAKVMKIMPVVFSIFFFFFPAGLVLYWLVNNVLSIAQQWHITRVLEAKGPAAATGKR
jgi:YidC/Oxa1 family membrane protein insertase